MWFGKLGARFIAITMLLSVLMAVSTKDAIACACCDTYAVVNVADWDVLNVRSAPSARARKVGALSPGTCGIDLLDHRRGWSKIRSGRLVGWVNARYLEYR